MEEVSTRDANGLETDIRKIRPVKKWFMVQPLFDFDESKTKRLIIAPDFNTKVEKHESHFAMVISVGSEVKTVKAGQLVIVAGHVGFAMDWDGTIYWIMLEDCLQAIVEVENESM